MPDRAASDRERGGGPARPAGFRAVRVVMAVAGAEWEMPTGVEGNRLCPRFFPQLRPRFFPPSTVIARPVSPAGRSAGTYRRGPTGDWIRIG